MFRVKICGITRAPDAIAAANAGADALGLNFFSRSPRYVSPETAQPIVSVLPTQVRKIGVFVNSTAAEITSVAERVGLDCIQLHGDEPAEMLAQLPAQLSIVSAYRCGARGLAPLVEYLDKCRTHGRMPDAVLIDAETDAADQYGGTGRLANWERIANDRLLLGDLPLVLAGGLTSDNVAEAIDAVRPMGVDVASGVESRPGEKDPKLVEQFVASARDAFLRYT